MNEHDDTFEQELRSFRPTPPSPHVAEQIKKQLDHCRRRRGWPTIALSAIGLAALIALAATVVLNRPADTPSKPPHIVESDQPQDALAQLSAWRYHQVARQSPRELMRLLDEQAQGAPAIGSPTPTVHQLLESNS